MKGKKLVFAVILSLIVCLLLVPSAFAEEQLTENNSDPQIVDTTGADTDGDNGGSNNDSQNNESTDKPADSGDSESKSDNDSTSDDEVQSGVNDDSSDESKDSTGSDDSDDDTDSEEEKSDTDSEEEKQENASEEETESNSEHSSNGDSKLPPQPDYTGFQVELTYNGKVVKMNGLKGGESHDFAQIIKELGIEGEVESAIGDADDLFNVTNDENGMHFNTLMAFETEQKLVVTVGGVEYVIIVTDDGATVDVGESDNLQDKINKAANGTIIKLKADFTGAFVIPEGKTITIDLNGKTLSGIRGSDNHVITNNGTLTVKGNGTVKAYGESSNFAVYNAETGVATLEGGTYTRARKGGDVIVNDGDITIKGTAVIDDGGICWTVVRNGWRITNDPKVKMTIEGGTITCNQTDPGDANTVIRNEGTLIIKDGKFERTGRGDLITNVGNNTSLTINGGEFKSDYKKFLIFDVANNGTFTATGGIFSDDCVKDYIDEYAVLVKSGNMYAVNESGYELAKSGSTVEIIQAPAGEIDGVPGGVTVINNSKNTVIINGVEVAPGESYTTPTPTAYTEPYSAKYFVIDGKNQEWTKGSNESIMFTLNSSAVTKVLIDGVEVEFEVDKDGKIVISAEVLEALEAGEHIVEFIFADGNCKTNIIIK